MAFTFALTNENNLMETYDLQISINPDAAIINHTYEVGDAAAGTIAVENTGAENANLYLTADWGPSAGTTDRQATLLANALVVSVTVSSDDAVNGIADTTVYTGRLIDLIDVSIFAVLEPNRVADVKISVVLPDEHSGPTLLSKSLLTDFVFVAVSVE